MLSEYCAQSTKEFWKGVLLSQKRPGERRCRLHLRSDLLEGGAHNPSKSFLLNYGACCTAHRVRKLGHTREFHRHGVLSALQRVLCTNALDPRSQRFFCPHALQPIMRRDSSQDGLHGVRWSERQTLQYSPSPLRTTETLLHNRPQLS